MQAPRKRELNITNVKGAAPGAKEYRITDTKLAGFALRVWPSGKKVFTYEYRPQGSRLKQKVTIGIFGAITPEQARTEATRLAGLRASGANPAADRAAKRTAASMADLAKDWLADGADHWKPSTHREYTRLWTKHLARPLGPKAVADVTTAQCAAIHRSLKAKPYNANRVRDALVNLFKYAEMHGVRPKHTNPARDVVKYKERAKERFLTPEEASRLGDALTRAATTGLPPAPTKRKARKDGPTSKHTTKAKLAGEYMPANPFTVAAIRFLILSGWRKREALTLEWAMIDVARQTATLPDTKTGKSVRHLGAPAIALLESLPRLTDSRYCFPGKSPKAPLVEVNRVWFAVRHAAQLDDVRLHDLRHSFASTIASGGGSLLLIAKLLGHKSTRSTERYSHLLDDPLKATADTAAETIAALLDSPKVPAVKLS